MRRRVRSVVPAAAAAWLVLLVPGAVGAGVPPIPELRIPACEAPPILDGVLSDACWRRAAMLDSLHLVGTEILTNKHTVRLTADRKWLYVAFDAYLPADRNPLTFTTHDSKVHREDNVQVAFSPGGDSETFYQFWLSRDGVRAESRFSRDQGWQIFWDVPWRSAVAGTGTGYTAEIALPWSVLRATGDPAKARINVMVNSVVPVRDQQHVKVSDRHEQASWAPLVRSRRGSTECGLRSAQPQPTRSRAGRWTWSSAHRSRARSGRSTGSTVSCWRTTSRSSHSGSSRTSRPKRRALRQSRRRASTACRNGTSTAGSRTSCWDSSSHASTA